MKNGWESKELKAVSAINYGYTESASADPIGPRFLRITDIQNDNVEWKNVPYCNIAKDDLPKYRLKAGDIVFARTGATTGKSFLVSDPPKEAVFASYLIRLRLLDKDLSPEFVSLFFQTAEYWRAIKEGSSGSAQGGFNASKLGALSIPFPPIPEQRRIVGILDEAFAGIATAKANAEKNLQNARALFESHLNAVFTQRGDGELPTGERSAKLRPTDAAKDEKRVTRTGGRDATTRHIAPELALAVGMPVTRPSRNWNWTALTDLARLESGHTPSRRHPEYWNGQIPWIGIKDAKVNHGRHIVDTEQKTNDLGLANSSARLLPKNTVCLSRTASVGYVVVMGKPMATSQDFVNWVCSNRLVPDFLKYVFLAEGREGFFRYSSGAVHQTIYYPEAKAFHIAHPDIAEQQRIVLECDELRAKSQRLESIYRRKLAALDELKKSLLFQAFSGQL
ncbi:restriction endonuclease subunit S [Lignipirellula cremea]|uniref:Type-1 restriction enzyme EcoKI specificity protein n=1 Tax=Lignipirellula cremea TaxID=2528010 RepID=A0A518DTL4_9BACT|nr:restriction endonuclease subunit S [Lignipirellula cremea]QDU95181.1 Type-1 restriction enzyme EcoKI specificity protein [Lignipirellula cremea]